MKKHTLSLLAITTAIALSGCNNPDDQVIYRTAELSLSAAPQALILTQGQEYNIDISTSVQTDKEWTLNSVTDSQELGSVIRQSQHAFDYLAQIEGMTTLNYDISSAQENAQSQIVVAINGEATSNHPPLAKHINLEALDNQAVTVDLRQHISDEDNDTLTIKHIVSPSKRFSLASDGYTLTFTPNGFVGVDQVIYIVEDAHQGLGIGYAIATSKESSPSTPNNAPIAKDYAVNMDKTNTSFVDIELSALGLISDKDNDTLKLAHLFAGNGRATIQPNNVIRYEPNSFTGIDQFSYVISDEKGGNAVATITMTVTDSTSNNRPPVAQYIDKVVNVDNGIKHTFSVASSVSDPDNDALTIVEVLGGSSIGRASIDANDPLTLHYDVYDPNGQMDNFVYIISDGNGGYALNEVSIMILNTNPS